MRLQPMQREREEERERDRGRERESVVLPRMRCTWCGGGGVLLSQCLARNDQGTLPILQCWQCLGTLTLTPYTHPYPYSHPYLQSHLYPYSHPYSLSHSYPQVLLRGTFSPIISPSVRLLLNIVFTEHSLSYYYLPVTLTFYTLTQTTH